MSEDKSQKFGFETRMIHAGAQPEPITGARQTPIHQNTSYVFHDADHAASLFNLQTFGFIYSRLTNPTVAVLEERGRLARELHDAVSQSLYSMMLFAEAGRRSLAQGDLELAQERLERLVETSQETFREMRLLVHELRPPDLREGG